jgi:hypothetical protein
VAMYGGAALAVATAFLAWRESEKTSAKLDVANRKLDDANGKLDVANGKLDDANRKLVQNDSNAERRAVKFESMLAPFVQIATAQHPGASEADALKLLRADYDRLGAQTRALAERVAPRHLTNAAKAQMLTLLSTAGRCTAQIEAPVSGEGFDYASEVAKVFQAAGWWQSDTAQQDSTISPTRGTRAWFTEKPHTRCDTALLSALKIAGVSPKIIGDRE